MATCGRGFPLWKEQGLSPCGIRPMPSNGLASRWRLENKAENKSSCAVDNSSHCRSTFESPRPLRS